MIAPYPQPVPQWQVGTSRPPAPPPPRALLCTHTRAHAHTRTLAMQQLSIALLALTAGRLAQNDEASEDMGIVNSVFRGIRSMRSTYQLTRERPVCYCKVGDARVREVVAREIVTVQTMGQCGELKISGMDACVQ
jgi:hypothetical protein